MLTASRPKQKQKNKYKESAKQWHFTHLLWSSTEMRSRHACTQYYPEHRLKKLVNLFTWKHIQSKEHKTQAKTNTVWIKVKSKLYLRPAIITERHNQSCLVFSALLRDRKESRAGCNQYFRFYQQVPDFHALIMSLFPKPGNLRFLSTPLPPSRLFRLRNESFCAVVINSALW